MSTLSRPEVGEMGMFGKVGNREYGLGRISIIRLRARALASGNRKSRAQYLHRHRR